jgi:hypothetical protein
MLSCTIRFVVLPFVLLMSLAAAACPRTEWVDPDTPASVCAGKTDSSGAKVELVFSDEFEVPGRTFRDGEDPRWTAVTGFPSSNSQVNAYVDSPLHATTAGGKLQLRADASNNHMEYHETQYVQSASRPYATPMLQSWNKFCFQEGLLEMSAQLPGISTQGGLWPAFWVMGNLGRATAQKSTDKIWPFSYSHCPSEAEKAANQYPEVQQEINACREKTWTDQFGLNEGQGRGAIEIDIVEAMPGDFIFAYKEWKADPGHCPKLPEDQYALLESPRPMVATSLQLAPGIPYGSDQRPLETNTKHGGNVSYNCVPSDWSKQWYPELKQGNLSSYGTAYRSQPNVDFWGEYFKANGSAPDGIDLQTDSLSSLNTLPHEAYTGQHVYVLDWKAGPDGYVDFQMDGKKQFHVNASSALREHDITDEGIPVGRMLGRQMPEEPSYLMLNIDLSTRWGWPDCNPKYCNCCSDCRDTKCTTCYYPWEPTKNSRQWLANLCKTLPAWYEIDYVRVWQRPNNIRTGCSPKDYPTQGWIESHRDRYVLPNMNEPLRPVLSGGHQCSSSADCGGSVRGSCSIGVCQCTHDFTGPRCLVKRIGASSVCRPLEEAAVGGAACYTTSKSDCGSSHGRGVCVEAARPGGIYTPNQTYMIAPGVWEKAGGGDGRCECNAGWAGTSCSVILPMNSSVPKHPPNPAWMGETIEEFIKERCNCSIQTPELARACDEVLWKPHWKTGGAYAGCGAWLRAYWVAKAASCELEVEVAKPEDMFWIYLGVGAGLAAVFIVLAFLFCLQKAQQWKKSELKPPCSNVTKGDVETGGKVVLQ